MEEEKNIEVLPEEAALWQRVVEAREQSIQNLEETLLVEKKFLETAKKELEAEKEKI